MVDKEELTRFFDYLYDKTEECYKQEVKQSMERFMEGVEIWLLAKKNLILLIKE